jgi:hypothetical protein
MANSRSKLEILSLGLCLIIAGCGQSASESGEAVLTPTSSSEVTTVPANNQKLPVIAMTASPVIVMLNGSTTVEWSATDAIACIASGSWSGNKSTAGSQTFNGLLEDATYRLSCSGVSGNTTEVITVTVAAAPSAPAINLSASPSSLPYNGSTTLSWTSNNTTGCSASGDWNGNRATSGSQVISGLTTDSSFSLSCTGAGGTVSDSVSISVAAPAEPTINLSASPSNLPFNGSTTLSWNSSNATSCTASRDWSGSKGTSGSQTINSLTADSVFRLSCTGPGGTTSNTVNVNVAAAAAPSVNLSASSTNLAYNGSTTLTWNSNNSTSCSASGDWTGNKNTSGSQVISALTADSNFTLSCSGDGGTANDTVSVSVASPQPNLSFSASPNTVNQNGSTTLTWSSTNASACTASGDWSGNKNTSGSQTINALTVDSQFTLTCGGTGGNVNQTIDVAVVLSSTGTALLSWTPPTQNSDGSTLTDLAGYRIRYGTASGDYSDVVEINNPGITSHLIENLPSAEYYFVMVAFNGSGIESTYSAEVSKVVN